MKIKTVDLVLTALLSVLGALLMFVDFSVPFMPFFIKMDISELPALIGAFTMNPILGCLVCLGKNILNFFIKSTTGGVGEAANFILGSSFVLAAGYVYKFKKTKSSALIGCILGAVVMGILSVPINYFVTYPLYAKIMPIEQIISLYQNIFPVGGGLLGCLVFFNMPFTILKGLLCSLVTFLIYKRISKFIKSIRG